MTWRNEPTNSNKALDRVFDLASMIDLGKASGQTKELVKEILLVAFDQCDKEQARVLQSTLHFLGSERMKQIGFLCGRKGR
jgi:hypothetical protein